MYYTAIARILKESNGGVFAQVRVGNIPNWGLAGELRQLVEMRVNKLAGNPCFLIQNCKGNNNATDMKDKRNKSRVFMRDVALYLQKFKEIANSINPCSREKIISGG